ncbi:2-oxo-4-hydroxy-4-carboxy-5-ureidoimidazoline decarboxylase [Pullulanibacillus sp. KACC 23026]|uniref:2-oxo-4-hydroxy-4-carboxy-5-ureidoimidazoline decarboxylase n=1 Tax=Pullulanibacillus sp. KACC 23026 TaxID=3028315 RepID=UPI0023AF75A9|nr:2-oxo-4-hydroxy-4-carboxy-5-ureidoimidazoline decarboxylase [Pullulanibacillus sp. KACC 23026]WEG13489.1 2-oxo-4-hydroxy-4-carboxy-5-ureidoimidazoline decarboxylase [Pullulanibacillus sp. KACC 23026]
MMTLKTLNDMSESDFVDQLKAIYEHSPWVGERVLNNRPFLTLEALHSAMVHAVMGATKSEQLRLIKAHPNLGARIAMSSSSVSEQKGAGLSELTEDEYQRFQEANQAYMAKFNFPFILAVKGKDKHLIYKALKERHTNSIDAEFKEALHQIHQIARHRLEAIFN